MVFSLYCTVELIFVSFVFFFVFFNHCIFVCAFMLYILLIGNIVTIISYHGRPA